MVLSPTPSQFHITIMALGNGCLCISTISNQLWIHLWQIQTLSATCIRSISSCFEYSNHSSSILGYTLVILLLINLWYYYSFVERVLSHFQISLIGPITTIILILTIMPLPGEVSEKEAMIYRNTSIAGTCFAIALPSSLFHSILYGFLISFWVIR